jgi:hypothetical protein
MLVHRLAARSLRSRRIVDSRQAATWIRTRRDSSFWSFRGISIDKARLLPIGCPLADTESAEGDHMSEIVLVLEILFFGSIALAPLWIGGDE